MIGRRRFLGATTLCLPLLAVAQPALRRIGYLDQGSASGDRVYLDALRDGLRDLGWVDGRNIFIETRFAEGATGELPRLAADLVKSRVELIATWSTPAALAAKRASATIPIVIGFTADPVGSGIVASLAHPGGNITGWTHVGVELRAKYLELLKDAVPDAARFGVLWNPANQVHRPSLKVIESAAQRLGVELYLAGARDADSLESAFSDLVDKHVQALIVFPDGMFIAQMARIVALAAQHRLPAMYGVREYAPAGGLMFYGASLSQMQRQVGSSLIDKILRGASPADLPIERPTKFELVINMKTARTLGLAIPQPVLLRADELIQ
jgi:putative ABC transport system substrate-binding protein